LKRTLIGHYARENIVTNNIFAFNGEEQVIKARPESHASIRFLGNIVVHNGGNILGGRWEGDGAEFEDNLYWNFAGPVEFGKRDLAARRALGNDTRSIIADPLFVDAIDGDFHLTAGSPAERMGFKDIGDQTYGCDRATPEPMPRMYP